MTISEDTSYVAEWATLDKLSLPLPKIIYPPRRMKGMPTPVLNMSWNLESNLSQGPLLPMGTRFPGTHLGPHS